MKILISFLLLSISSAVLAEFPMDNVQVTVTKIEAWPSAGNYTAWVKDPIPGTGCTHTTTFAIEKGPGAEAAYSTLMAAVLANKQVELYLTRCEYSVVADRVRLIP